MTQANSVVEALLSRSSMPALSEPAPAPEELSQIFGTALRAPDHGLLRPWRYLVLEGEGLRALGDLFVQAVRADDPQASDAAIERAQRMPLRAPMMVIAISKNLSDDKVPVVEQQISAGVGMGYMLVALQALGFGGIWRTGPMASHRVVREGLGLAPQETLIGFLYLGTPSSAAKKIPELDVGDYFSAWPC